MNRWPGRFSDSTSELSGNKSTTAVSNAIKKPVGSIRRPSLTSRPSTSGLQPIATVSKPPMRVLVPPSKRPSSSTTKITSVGQQPSRHPPITGSLPKPAVATTKTAGKSTDGPRRILVQVNDKPAPRTISTSVAPTLKTQGPQRVLVRSTPGIPKPVKKPLGPSSSINPPAPTSRLPGPSRIAVPSTTRPMARTSNVSKSAGRWV